MQSSYRHTFAMGNRNVFGRGTISLQELSECGTENVVRVTLFSSRFQPVLATEIDKLFGVDSIPEGTRWGKMLSDKLTVLINDISIGTKQLGYGSYRGTTYKKDSRSKFTYAYSTNAMPQHLLTPWQQTSFF